MRQLFLAFLLIFYSVNSNSNFGHVLPVTETAATDVEDAPATLPPQLISHVLKINKHIGEEQAEKIIVATTEAATEFSIDPLLLLALIKVESRFDQDAIGSGGSSKGLVQVIPYWHKEKIADGRRRLNTYSVFDLKLNTWLGAAILKEYMSKTKTVHAALVRYNASPTAPLYANAVLAEYKKLKSL